MKKTPKKVDVLPGTFMLTGMFGFVITIIYTTSGRIPLDYGVAFCIVFLIMLIVSLRSIMPSQKIWIASEKIVKS